MVQVGKYVQAKRNGITYCVRQSAVCRASRSARQRAQALDETIGKDTIAEKRKLKLSRGGWWRECEEAEWNEDFGTSTRPTYTFPSGRTRVTDSDKPVGKSLRLCNAPRRPLRQRAAAVEARTVRARENAISVHAVSPYPCPRT